MRIILCVLFISFLSCGKKFPDYKQEEVFQYEEAEGEFNGDFKTLNRVLRRFNANLLVWIKGDQFYVKIYLKNGPQRIRYQQYMHKGSRCPTMNDDLDKNGMIDFSEVVAVSGEVLMPLDGYIQAVKRGSEWYPTSNKQGSYYYSRSASLKKMMKDLFQTQKLSRDENLDLGSRTIVIYGTLINPLMPIACAVLTETRF